MTISRWRVVHDFGSRPRLGFYWIGIGCEWWPGKPKFLYWRGTYDGENYALHLGPLWLTWVREPNWEEM